MKNLSIYDRKFLAACKISTSIEPSTDEEFLFACGIDTTLTPEEFFYENKHRDISNCRGCGARTFEQHTVECPHRALDGSRADFEAMRRNVAQKYAKHCAECVSDDDSINNAPSAGDCGESSHTTLSGIPIDGTVHLLQSLGLPVTAENWMNLQFAGHPPTPPFDGEVLSELPRWVRAAYDSDYEPDDEEGEE